MLSSTNFPYGNATTAFTNITSYYEDIDENLTPLWTVVAMTLVYAVILITGVTGNICACVVIYRNKYMHTATNYYLFSLAVSDLTLLLLGLPQELFQLWKPQPYIFGEVFCIFRGFTSETSTNASILTITSFTMERYLAICHPLKAHAISKLSRVIRIIIAVWVLSSLGALPVSLQLGIVHEVRDDGIPVPETANCEIKRPLNHAFEFSTLMFFVLPMILISVLYVIIGIQLRKTSSPVSGRSFVPSAAVSADRATATTFSSPLLKREGYQAPASAPASRRAVVKMLVAVVVAFFLCWAPFHAQRLMAIHVQDPTEADRIVYTVLTYISGVTYYLSATINPILYSIMSLKFRQAFKDTLAHCCTGSANRRYPMRYTYSSHPNSTIRSTLGYDGTDLSIVSDSPRHRTDSCNSRRGRPAVENGKNLVVSKRETEVSPVSKKGSLLNGNLSMRSKRHNADEISTNEVSKHLVKSAV